MLWCYLANTSQKLLIMTKLCSNAGFRSKVRKLTHLSYSLLVEKWYCYLFTELSKRRSLVSIILLMEPRAAEVIFSSNACPVTKKEIKLQTESPSLIIVRHEFKIIHFWPFQGMHHHAHHPGLLSVLFNKFYCFTFHLSLKENKQG